MKVLNKIKAFNTFKNLSPKAKKVYYMVGGVFIITVIAIGNLFSSAFDDNEYEEKNTASNQQASARVSISNTQGRKTKEGVVDAEFKKALVDNQKKEQEEATSSGASYAPDAELVEWADASQETEADLIEKQIDTTVESPRVQRAMKQKSYRELTPEQMVHHFEMKRERINSLFARWDEKATTYSVAYESPQVQGDEAIRSTESSEELVADKEFIGMMPGDEFAVSFNYSTNTDVTKDMVADILNGPFKGGKLTSKVTMKNGYALYASRYVSYKGKFFQAQGVLIDSQSQYGSAGFSDDTDWHRLYRYGSLFLSGLGAIPEMVLKDGTTEITVEGEVVSEKTEYDTKDYVIAAVGGVGTKAAETARNNFETPPTVYVNKNHIARMIFTEPVEVPWLKKQ